MIDMSPCDRPLPLMRAGVYTPARRLLGGSLARAAECALNARAAACAPLSRKLECELLSRERAAELELEWRAGGSLSSSRELEWRAGGSARIGARASDVATLALACSDSLRSRLV